MKQKLLLTILFTLTFFGLYSQALIDIVKDSDGDGCYVERRNVDQATFDRLKRLNVGWKLWNAGMNKGDCNDDDPNVCEAIRIVEDKDKDGCWIGELKLFCGIPADIPEGWRKLEVGMTKDDCNDNNPNLCKPLSIVEDKDNDGCWVGQRKAFCGFVANIPVGWRKWEVGMKMGDCDDNDRNVCEPFNIVEDKDKDGCYIGFRKPYCGPVANIPAGWRKWEVGLTPDDCNDNDPKLCKQIFIVEDKDKDGCWIGLRKPYCGLVADIPVGWRQLVVGMIMGDCDDNDAKICKLFSIVEDKDKDGCYIGPRKPFCGPIASIPVGWRKWEVGLTEGDCDDNDPKVCKRMAIGEDQDGDGHFTNVIRGFCQPLAQIPTGWRLLEDGMTAGDCDDGDPTIWRNACVSTPIPGKPNQWTNATMCVGILAPPGSWFCVGATPIIAETIFTVYPNPVSDRLNITPTENLNERVEIKLVDQYARVVRALQVPNAVKGQTFTINTTDLKPGIYQLTIRRGEMVESKTVAVKL